MRLKYCYLKNDLDGHCDMWGSLGITIVKMRILIGKDKEKNN